MSIYLWFQHHLQFTKIHYRTIADQKCPAAVDRNMKKTKKQKMVITQTVKNSNSTGESLGDQEQNTE